MCGVAEAGLALAIMSTVASTYAQKEQADAQKAYQEAQSAEYARVAELNQESANREFVESTTAERIKQMQERAAAAVEEQRIQRERLEKQGQALASSEASGMALDALMADFYRSEAQKKSIIQQQLDMSRVGSEITIGGYKDRRDSRMKSQSNYITSPVNQPNYLASALQIGQAGLDYYNKKHPKTP
jgi:hypothetical protein